MPILSIAYPTEAERLALEQAVAFFTQMRQVAATAPDGTVLAACEQVALDAGRRLHRDTLAAAVQARADQTDAQKVPGSRSKGRPGRLLLTAVGRIRLTRTDLSGAETGFPVDGVRGVDGSWTTTARRMAVRAGSTSRSPKPSRCSPT
jgi:hypothetical protein